MNGNGLWMDETHFGNFQTTSNFVPSQIFTQQGNPGKNHLTLIPPPWRQYFTQTSAIDENLISVAPQPMTQPQAEQQPPSSSRVHAACSRPGTAAREILDLSSFEARSGPKSMQTCRPLPTPYITPLMRAVAGWGRGDGTLRQAGLRAPRDGKGARQCNCPRVQVPSRTKRLDVPPLSCRPRIFPELVTFRGPVPLSAGVGPEVAGRAMQRVLGGFW